MDVLGSQDSFQPFLALGPNFNGLSPGSPQAVPSARDLEVPRATGREPHRPSRALHVARTHPLGIAPGAPTDATKLCQLHQQQDLPAWRSEVNIHPTASKNRGPTACRSGLRPELCPGAASPATPPRGPAESPSAPFARSGHEAVNAFPAELAPRGRAY